jgi:hypothetical protein
MRGNVSCVDITLRFTTLDPPLLYIRSGGFYECSRRDRPWNSTLVKTPRTNVEKRRIESGEAKGYVVGRKQEGNRGKSYVVTIILRI